MKIKQNQSATVLSVAIFIRRPLKRYRSACSCEALTTLKERKISLIRISFTKIEDIFTKMVKDLIGLPLCLSTSMQYWQYCSTLER